MTSWYNETALEKDAPEINELMEKLSFDFCTDEEVEEFFNSLPLLYHTSCAYLVPDSGMLPPESVRFFYVDENWTDAYMDGALSIGRSCSQDKQHDSAVIRSLHELSYKKSASLRGMAFNKPETPNVSVKTGFLMHSQLIRGWPGLEICCFQNSAELPILRLDRIGDSILLCIAGGNIDEIEFAEPEEGLYFGFDEKNGELVQQLVSLKEPEAGKGLPQTVPASWRNNDKTSNVLDIASMAANMEHTLKQLGKNGNYFSSPEFSAQMLHRRMIARMKITWK